jgi:hypothetical protein
MSTPTIPDLYRLKTRSGYLASDVDKNSVVSNNLTVTRDSIIHGKLFVKESSVFKDTVHIDNTSELNITTPLVNVTTDNINIQSDVSIDTQKLNITSHDDINVVADKKVSFTGSDDVTISIPNKKFHVTGEVDITGDLVIDSGDIVLNGMSVGDVVSNTFRPIHQQMRLINPFCLGIYGGDIPAASCPSSSFLQGWYYSDLVKTEYNLANSSAPKNKINWYFRPGTNTTKMGNFKGLNIETTLHNVTIPYVVIYTVHVSGENNGASWYQSKLNLIYKETSVLEPEDAALATSVGLPASLVYGDYSNTQTLGTKKLTLVYDSEYSKINTATTSNMSCTSALEAIESIKDQTIKYYTIQTNSDGVNYDFIVHDYTFTETNTIGTKTFETSFINVLQSIM